MFFFQSDPSLAAETQGLGLKFSIENEIFEPRMKISSENDFFVRVGMVFSSDRARMNFFDLWALRESSLAGFLGCSIDRKRLLLFRPGWPGSVTVDGSNGSGFRSSGSWGGGKAFFQEWPEYSWRT